MAQAGGPDSATPRSGSAGRRFAADAAGATSIEYALIAGLIFVVICGSLRVYASRVSDVYQTIGNTISRN